MEPIDHAARSGNWAGCSLALVGALDELSEVRAAEVARQLVEGLETLLPASRERRWAKFTARAHRSISDADIMQYPDRLIALASAVTDAIAAIEMARHEGARDASGTSPRRPDWLRGVKAFGKGDSRQDLWPAIHQFLARVPELGNSVRVGIYRPGRAQDYARKAVEAGIL